MDNGTNEDSARVKTFWLRMRTLNRIAVRRLRQGWGARRSVLLLTTTGRRSGLPRVTPLQFEEQDGLYYVWRYTTENVTAIRQRAEQTYLQSRRS